MRAKSRYKIDELQIMFDHFVEIEKTREKKCACNPCTSPQPLKLGYIE